MYKTFTRALMGSAIVLLAGGVASAATSATPKLIAQASPSPKPSVSAPAFTYSGFLRSYYFTRTNGPGRINQAAFNTAVNLHGQLDLGSGFAVGATYLYANPFNNCDDPASHITAGNCKTKTFNALAIPQPVAYDDTLPAYRLSTMYEGYLQYKNPAATVWVGQRVINTPWANASDSRLKPVSFRGGDALFNLDKSWQIEAGDYISWEDRVQSDFVKSTLITQNGSYPDAGGQGTTGIPSKSWVDNNGFLYGRLGYASGPLSANGYLYAFNNIANALWFDAKYSWKAYAKPFIAFQGGTESNTGTALAGKINSQVFGVQLGATPWKNVDLTLGFNDIPQKSDNITLPTGVKCGTNHLISGTGPASPLSYFLPAGGTPNCFSSTPGISGGPATVYYGGWASPYTDSYATDQLFTTTISQGMADRRSAGSGVKVGSTINLDQKQVRIILAHAWYQYGNNVTGYAPTQETNIDGTYFFSKVPAKGAYHGFSIRHRYAERDTFPAFGGLPVFKYNRTQLEFDF
ncbi:MAG TPA: hypothetical protein VFL13_16200 [Candidatus Baltobacteraceae bacterium]|nr:hypothetical protein [Candidatus Baltobacteraceae bacterium]